MNELFVFKTKWGQAAVHISTVLGVLPDTQDSNRSLIITSFQPDGISAEEKASKLLGDWSELLDENTEVVEETWLEFVEEKEY